MLEPRAMKLYKQLSPSLRGSGLKLRSSPLQGRRHRVSLFTREWIEIAGRTSRMHTP